MLSSEPTMNNKSEPHLIVYVPVMALSSIYFTQFLTGKPTVCELCEHVNIGTKWYQFGVLLQLDTTKLDNIREMNGDNDFKAIKMFELWLSTNPSGTRREIMETLKKPAIGKNAVAEEYNKALTESE